MSDREVAQWNSQGASGESLAGSEVLSMQYAGLLAYRPLVTLHSLQCGACSAWRLLAGAGEAG